MKKILSLLVISAWLSSPVVAQRATGNNDENEDDPFDSKSYFMYGLNYLSDNVYLGRKDTAAVPYVSPYIGYHHKSGLYAKVLVSDAPTKGRVDLLTLEAGYDHTFGDHFTAGFNADRFVYNKNSRSIRSSIKESVGAYGQYGNDWIEPQLSIGLDFNKKTDYIAGLALDHDFKALNNSLHIIPTIAMNAATQHFYDEYFTNRLLLKDKSLKIKQVLADAGRFKPRDYELSVKVTYWVNKWLFTLIPTYTIPVNPATISFPKTTFTEKVSNSFFVELDVCHR